MFFKKSLYLKSLFLPIAAFCLASCSNVALPAPVVGEGYLSQTFQIDKNINVETIDSYLFRQDVAYFDMRLFEDPGDYEALGGDSHLSGYVDSFEVAPYPYIGPLIGLPDEVGPGYIGPKLYDLVDGNYVAKYKESKDIVNSIFPKDKAIFLMCGGGGYAYMMKCLLLALGYDSNSLYNTGGYWYYHGDHNIEVKRVEDGVTYYDFAKVPYHYIDFSSLTEI